jgi:hypothetical protein
LLSAKKGREAAVQLLAQREKKGVFFDLVQ